MLPDSLISALSGLGGVFLGAWLVGRRERAERRRQFIESQLKDFYSPMLGLRKEIEARSEMRVRIQSRAESAWASLSAAVDQQGAEASRQMTAARIPEFQRLIEYDNEKFVEESLPAYRKMVAMFRDQLWLADPDTREHFRTLVDYVEVWERFYAKALPREVLVLLGHTEAKLRPFYAHLESRLGELRKKAEGG